MRFGCLNLLVRVGVVSAAAVLAAVSAALILAFAVSALGQPDGFESIFRVLVASVAALAFFLVGRSIWRDMRERGSSSLPEAAEGRAPAEKGGGDGSGEGVPGNQ